MLLRRPESRQGTDLPVRQWIKDHDKQFQAEGYMVIRNVVPASITGNAVREIAAFVGADLANSATWYGGAPETRRHCTDAPCPVFVGHPAVPESLPGVRGVLWKPTAHGGYQPVYFSPPSPSALAGHQSRKYSLGHRPEGAGTGFVAGRRIVDRRSPQWGWFPVRS